MKFFFVQLMTARLPKTVHLIIIFFLVNGFRNRKWKHSIAEDDLINIYYSRHWMTAPEIHSKESRCFFFHSKSATVCHKLIEFIFNSCTASQKKKLFEANIRSDTHENYAIKTYSHKTHTNYNYFASNFGGGFTTFLCIVLH